MANTASRGGNDSLSRTVRLMANRLSQIASFLRVAGLA